MILGGEKEKKMGKMEEGRKEKLSAHKKYLIYINLMKETREDVNNTSDMVVCS